MKITITQISQSKDYNYKGLSKKGCGRIYISQETDTVMTHLFDRCFKPYELYKKLVIPQVKEQLKVSNNFKVSWSQHAGCTCNCSPGFIVTNNEDLQYTTVYVTVKIEEEESDKTESNKLNGQTFCITGTLSQGRKEIEEMITKNGGIISTVKSELDYLIVGVDYGSKYSKAVRLGIRRIDEKQLLNMIQ